MPDETIFDRLYALNGGEDTLTRHAKDRIVSSFVGHFSPVKPSGGLIRRLFAKPTPQSFTKKELLSKLVQLNVAENPDDAEKLFASVVSTEYHPSGKEYEFIGSRCEDGQVRYTFHHNRYVD